MRIEVLNNNLEQKYNDFILSSEKNLLYASLKYRNFLKDFLGAKDHYLIAVSDNNEIKGVLPLFIKENDKYGNVVNSLPFYGSNGGLIADKDDFQVKRFLLKHYQELINNECLKAGTIITSPFEGDHSFYDEELKYNFKETRIGQITIFPESSDKLMDVFHQKTRNTVRKGIKTGVVVNWKTVRIISIFCLRRIKRICLKSEFPTSRNLFLNFYRAISSMAKITKFMQHL